MKKISEEDFKEDLNLAMEIMSEFDELTTEELHMVRNFILELKRQRGSCGPDLADLDIKREE